MSVLSKGHRINGPKGQKIELQALLGGGKYSEVWKATLSLPGGNTKEVAVKFMATDLDDSERQIYFRETENLIRLMKYGNESGLWEKSVPLVPEFFFADKSHKPPYFVQSLAIGKPIDEIIREGTPMIEADVVYLGAQLCRVFQALHEGLNRSYLDFQPRNIFLNIGKSGRGLTVIDWNLLSAEGDCDVEGDLLTIARLLYRLAIGCPPSPQQLELPANWSSLSRGLRTFFVKALHPLFSRLHYPDAGTMQHDLIELDRRWTKSGKQLIQDAAKIIGEVETSEETHEANLENILIILDIAKRKDLDATTQELSEKLERDALDRLGDPGYIRKVIQYYRIGDLVRAREVLQDASAAAITSQTKLQIARWSAALEFKDGDKDNYVKLANSLDECTGQWLHSQVVDLDPFAELSLGLDGNHPFSIEAGFWQSIRIASRSDRENLEIIQKCIDQYNQALASAEKLPYSQNLLYVVGGVDLLQSEIEFLSQQAKKIIDEAALRERLETTINTISIRAIDILRQELENQSGAQITSDYVIDFADKLVNQKEYSLAKRLINSTWQDLSPAVQEKAITLKRDAQEQLDRERDIREAPHESIPVFDWNGLLELLNRGDPQLGEMLKEHFLGAQFPSQTQSNNEGVGEISPIELIKEKLEKGEIGESEILQRLGIQLHQQSDGMLDATKLQDDDIDPSQTHLRNYKELLNDSNLAGQDAIKGKAQTGNNENHLAETLISGPTMEVAPVRSPTGEESPALDFDQDGLSGKDSNEIETISIQKQLIQTEHNESSKSRYAESDNESKKAKIYESIEKATKDGTRTSEYDHLYNVAKQKASLKTMKGYREALELIDKAFKVGQSVGSDFLQDELLEDLKKECQITQKANAPYARAKQAVKIQNYELVAKEYSELTKMGLWGHESPGDWDIEFANFSFLHYHKLFFNDHQLFESSGSIPTRRREQFDRMRKRFDEMKKLEPHLVDNNRAKYIRIKVIIENIAKDMENSGNFYE